MGTMPSPIAVPKYPEVILVPRLVDPPPTTLKLLERMSKDFLQADETFSVTYSPVLCPEGKNYLFTLKPYWWEVAPGKWEYRDGRRNPYCDAPKGQRQLQSACKTIYTLSLAVAHLPELRSACMARAIKLLQIFFINPGTRMLPEVLYAQCNPSEQPLRGDQAFVVACRYLLLVSRALSWLTLPYIVDQRMKDWFKAHLHFMATSEQGAKARTYGNNITIWYHALVANHLFFVDPAEAVVYTRDSLRELISRYPQPADFFARELSRTRPRHYVLFTLEPMFLLVSVLASASLLSGIPGSALSYLAELVQFAQSVPGSDIELNVDNDERYHLKLAWFTRMLDQMRAKNSNKPSEPDGRGWAGGWNQFARLLYGFT